MTRKRIGILGLVVGTVVALPMVPGPAWIDLASPETGAVFGYLVTVGLLPFLRRRPRVEQIWFAVFLAAMPVVYIEAAYFGGVPIGVELVGLPIFAVLAVAGLRYPRVLVVSLLLHGLTWDAWHLSGHVVDGWYATACAVIDVSLAGYAASRAECWNKIRATP